MSDGKKNKQPCGHPCSDLQNARNKIKKLDKELKSMQQSLQQMHAAVNIAMEEYGRLHLEELTLKEIFKICDKAEISPLEAMQEVKKKCSDARACVKDLLKESKSKDK